MQYIEHKIFFLCVRWHVWDKAVILKGDAEPPHRIRIIWRYFKYICTVLKYKGFCDKIKQSGNNIGFAWRQYDNAWCVKSNR